MKTTFLTFIALCTVLFLTAPLKAQDDNMKKWMDYMTPGEMHKILEKGTGNWTMKTTWWMAPGTEPTSSEATAVSEMIMGNRYLQTKVTGSMMGMPFNGIAIDGYDNALKLFHTMWIDDMGTGIMTMTGTYNESAKQISYTGKMVDPMSGTLVDVRQIVTFNDDGTSKMEMYGPGPDGKEFKTMEIVTVKKN